MINPPFSDCVSAAAEIFIDREINGRVVRPTLRSPAFRAGVLWLELGADADHLGRERRDPRKLEVARGIAAFRVSGSDVEQPKQSLCQLAAGMAVFT